MTAWTPFVVEGALALLLLAVFAATLIGRGEDRRGLGALAAAGVLAILGLSFVLVPVAPALGGMFVLDGLALFAKRLFLAATFIGILAGLSSPEPSFARRAGEYHLLLLSSLLGMCVLASARDLLLLFLAFELMSIPLYVLAGFAKRDGGAVEAALKFFLVGSVSTGPSAMPGTMPNSTSTKTSTTMAT
ncbi:MAG TPA: proton-conducting transporter membrane subunit, partial [Terriglobales bacterium]|nr:proton-conducting transporter membrane subunit [Terriglobales bacterium]